MRGEEIRKPDESLKSKTPQQLGWFEYIEVTKEFLIGYPEDIFTGASGDPGPKFIVALRKAIAELEL